MDDELHAFKSKYQLDISDNLLIEALTHPSYRQIDPDVRTYEQLENLGDAVLDVLVTSSLLTNNPDMKPGDLTTKRSILVNNRSLSKLGRKIGIDKLVRKNVGYTIENSDIANIVEAIFGAAYVAGKMELCQQFYDQVEPVIQDITKNHDSITYNPISRLQEYCQQSGVNLPEYKLVSKEGPDHNPEFTMAVEVTIDGIVHRYTGKGSSKKIAKEKAAFTTLTNIQ